MPNVCRARYFYDTTDEINEAKTMQLHPILGLFVFTTRKTHEKFQYQKKVIKIIVLILGYALLDNLQYI